MCSSDLNADGLALAGVEEGQLSVALLFSRKSLKAILPEGQSFEKAISVSGGWDERRSSEDCSS